MPGLPAIRKVATPRVNYEMCPHCKSLVGYSPCHTMRRVIPLRCKRWTCRFCGPRNLGIVCRRVRAGNPNRFLTLTARSLPGEGPQACYARLRPQVSRLLQYLRKWYGLQHAVTFTERTSKGFPHWHILMSSLYTPQHVLSRLWERLAGSPIVHIRRVDHTETAINYCTKYVLKQSCVPRECRLGRIVNYTRHYPRVPAHRALDEGWTWVRESLHPWSITGDLWCHGSITRDDAGFLWCGLTTIPPVLAGLVLLVPQQTNPDATAHSALLPALHVSNAPGPAR